METGCVVSITDADFEREVLKDPGTVVVDFYTPTCSPCRQIAPVLEQLCGERRGKLKIVKMDAWENASTAAAHRVNAVPTLALYRNGKLVEQVTGAKSKEWFEKWIDAAQAS